MMNTMGRGHREKKNEKRDDPYGADGAKIVTEDSHGVDDNL